MGLNRNLLMGNTDTKNIKAFLTIENGVGNVNIRRYYGYFAAYKFGSISPNPLPNGIKITELYYFTGANRMYIKPTNVAVTINGIQIHDNESNGAVKDYMIANLNKTVPIIFHFE